MNLIFPREPKRGEPLEAAWGAQVVRCLRALALAPGLGYLIRRNLEGTQLEITARGGGGAAPIVRALTLTLAEPVGWERPEGQEGTPVFVTPGTVGGIMPDPSTFITPLEYIQSAGIRYVWAKIGVSPMAPLFATSLEFVTGTTSGAYTTGPFGSDGTPPEFVYVPLGYVSASGSPLVVHPPVNFGAGSIVVAMHIGDVTATETGLVQNFSRHLSYWRTDTNA